MNEDLTPFREVRLGTVDPADILRFFDEDGYLLFKNVLNTDLVLKARAYLTNALRSQGFVREDTTDPVATPGTTAVEVDSDALQELTSPKELMATAWDTTSICLQPQQERSHPHGLFHGRGAHTWLPCAPMIMLEHQGVSEERWRDAIPNNVSWADSEPPPLRRTCRRSPGCGAACCGAQRTRSECRMTLPRLRIHRYRRQTTAGLLPKEGCV